VVQTLCVLHEVPSGRLGLLHAPVAGLHVPAEWHWSLAMQTTGALPMHAPAWHVSEVVHALPSSHVVPSALFGLVQVPIIGSHIPAAWH
jgi:hypothetical protein